MDLIYADDTKKDIGIFDAYTLDLSYGEDENDFELKIDRSAHCCKAGYYIYVEGEEYGGVIEKIKVNTKSDEVTYSGPTWQGYIDHKVLCPDPGQDYLVADGEAHEVLADLIERLDLPALFEASTEDSGITVHYQFERYVTAYKGIKAMLKDAGAKLKIKWQNGKVIMRAEQVHDYSQDEEFDTSQVEFEVSREYAPVNHVICLGKGDLADRAVIHIFTDENGGIQPYAKVKNPVEDSDYILDTSRQVITGERENVSVLEMNSAQETTNYILQTSKPSDWATKYDAYYIQDGEKYVDLQKIDNALYYVDEDGALAENEDVDYYGTTLHAGRDGIIEGITFDEIGGEWSDEYYHYGNNGRSSVLELSFEVEDCDSFRFYLEAGGLHGAKVNGKWKIYVRHNGNWEFVQDINYTEPNGYFDIKLDGYKNFDAITACPMVQGNATYSAVFYLQNVHCVL